MRRATALTGAALMMLGVLASPAAAGNKIYWLPGSTAQVSKTDVFGPNCDHANPEGGGLGLPIFSGVKHAYWRLETALINVDALTLAELLVCGKLNPVAKRLTGSLTEQEGDGGIGAACGMSKGYDGEGYIYDEEKGYEIHLYNIRWKASASGEIVAIGDATWDGKQVDKGTGKLLAEVNAQGAGPCLAKNLVDPTEVLEKNDNKDDNEGAEFFTVIGFIEILQDPTASLLPKWKDLPGSEKGSQDNPATCKAEDEFQCPVYGPKKQDD